MAGSLRRVTDPAPRAIIYLRQSVHRDDSISLELQEIACRDYCDRVGYSVVAVEADPGISGRTWNRPAVQRVMTAIDDRDADVIVLWKWSRLSRSRKDWALAIDRADIAGGRIESATEPIDTATASGRFARGVMTEYAAFQSEQIGEQWEEVRQRRIGLGLPASGRLPFGWIRAAGGIAPHPENSPIVVEMYRRYLSGDGAAAIATWLNEQHIPAPNGGTWRRTRPLGVMDSPIHAGLIPYRGEIHPGQHTPIIDTQTRDAYLAERSRRRVHLDKPRDYHHLLSGIIECSCGARMHGKGSITAGKLYRGYLCSDTLKGHTERAYISALAIEPPITEWLETLNPAVDVTPPDPVAAARRASILREQNALEAELVTLTRQHTRNIVSERAYLRTSDEINGELERLRADERALPPTRSLDQEHVARLQTAWPLLTITEKNRGLRQVIDGVSLHADGHTFMLKTVWGHVYVLHGRTSWRGQRRTS